MSAPTVESISEQERSELADLASGIGRKYQDRKFADLDAPRDHWTEVCDAGLPAISLPPEYGGAGSMADWP